MPRLLAAEEGAHAVDERGKEAGVVAGMRVFDLDNFGAEVVQEHGADGAGQEAGEVEDAGGGEGSHAGSLAWVCGAWQ